MENMVRETSYVILKNCRDFSVVIKVCLHPARERVYFDLYTNRDTRTQERSV